MRVILVVLGLLTVLVAAPDRARTAEPEQHQLPLLPIQLPEPPPLPGLPLPVPGVTPTPTPTPAPSPTPAPEEGDSAPAPAAVPVLGETLVVRPDRGTVRVRLPGQGFRELDGQTAVPLTATVDATEGRAALQSQLQDGRVQTGRFSDGRFSVRQGPAGLTRLFLRGRLQCGSGARAAAAQDARKRQRKRKRRQLWSSDDGGRFETNGRDAVATVRGTRWLTRDTCRGTLVRVTRGAVDVRPRGRAGRTLRLTAGRSVLVPRR